MHHCRGVQLEWAALCAQLGTVAVTVVAPALIGLRSAPLVSRLFSSTRERIRRFMESWRLGRALSRACVFYYVSFRFSTVRGTEAVDTRVTL